MSNPSDELADCPMVPTEQSLLKHPLWGRVLFYAISAVIIGALIFLLIPDWHAQERAWSRRSRMNLSKIGQALHNYHDTHGTLPPAYIPDEEGRPMHSWRVLILPFLEEQDLFDRYDFDRPWDHPDNLKLIEQMPDIYASPHFREHREQGLTIYLAISAEGTVLGTTQPSPWEETAAPKGMVIEAKDDPVPWTKPVDISPNQVKANPEQANDRLRGGVRLLMSDGSVRHVKEDYPRENLEAGFYIGDGPGNAGP